MHGLWLPGEVCCGQQAGGGARVPLHGCVSARGVC